MVLQNERVESRTATRACFKSLFIYPAAINKRVRVLAFSQAIILRRFITFVVRTICMPTLSPIHLQRQDK